MLFLCDKKAIAMRSQTSLETSQGGGGVQPLNPLLDPPLLFLFIAAYDI